MSSNIWHIDLGFDWDAEPITSRGSTYPLQWGVVFMNPSTTPATPQVASMAQIGDGDSIYFYIYDVSAMSGESSPSGTAPSISSGWLSSNPGDSNVPSGTWPFTDTLATVNTCTISSSPVTSPSSIFTGGNWPSWQVLLNSSPFGATTTNASDPAVPYTFALTFTITAGNSSSSKTFLVDPEMIVEPG